MRGQRARVRGVRVRGPLLAALLSALLLALSALVPALAAVTVLYDGALGGQTPADQGYFVYGTYPSPPAAAVAGPVGGGTRLETSSDLHDYAGYFTPAGRAPAMRRASGYTLSFVAQVMRETHSLDDRAGFSVIVLGDDGWGVELGAWADRVWAQNDGATLFTQGEGVNLDLTAPVAFALRIEGDRYTLVADGAEVLSGPLRLYTPARSLESPLPGLYYVPNFIFLGDNTSRAGAEVRLLAVSLETVELPPAPPSPSPTGPTPSPTEPPSPDLPRERRPWAYLPAVVR
ncbi:MAG: hypothetical protein HGA45_24375 [Chloroflexales bacterium]|nr:hypothetical protein [Chloroflexales bacterium]